MITGIDLNATVDFTIKKDKKNPTIWKLGIMSSREMGKIATKVLSASASNVTHMIELVKKGVRGWANFKVNDNEIKFEADDSGMLDALVDIIPLDIITELGTEILRINKLGEEEEKN